MSSSHRVEAVGIVGSSGAVGLEMIKVLSQRQFPTKKLRLFANKSAGQVIPTGLFGDVTIEPFSVAAAQECSIVLLAVSGDFALKNAKDICGGPLNTVVIDNSSAFRNDPSIPLVIPEINAAVCRGAPLIANPNCTTAICAMALWPLHQAFGLKKVIMSSYQAASGAGIEGISELEEQLRCHVESAGRKRKRQDSEHEPVAGDATEEVPMAPPKVFAHQLAFNTIPHIDVFLPNGYTKEEMKFVWELRKLFGIAETAADSLLVSATAVRVPTLRAHAAAVSIETAKPVNPEECRAVCSKAAGVRVLDDPAASVYPMPLLATARDDVDVGRFRQSLVFGGRGVDLFVCGDQLLRGAALNAVLIAEEVISA